MDEKWIKPTAEELPVNGECTAYSGVDAGPMVVAESPATIVIPSVALAVAQ
jgi:hypothetical protein